MTEEQIDLADLMVSYEMGLLNLDKIVELFSRLIKSNQLLTLQGFYGRAARILIDAEYISRDGTINQENLTADKQKEFYC